MSDFNLKFNDSKREEIDLPWLNNISSTKQKIEDLIRASAEVNLSETELKLYFKSRVAEKMYKGILLEHNVASGEVANYALYRIVKLAEKIFKSVTEHFTELKSSPTNPRLRELQTQTVKIFVSILDFSFSIYSACRTENSALKIARILVAMNETFNQVSVSTFDRITVTDKIRREVVAQLFSASTVGTLSLPALHLLEILSYLGVPLTEEELTRLISLKKIDFNWACPQIVDR